MGVCPCRGTAWVPAPRPLHPLPPSDFPQVCSGRWLPMITFCATRRPRLVHHGKARVVRDRYQRPEVFDVGSKWKIVYWDYTTTPRSKRSKVWAKSKVRLQKEAQRLADQFMEDVNK